MSLYTLTVDLLAKTGSFEKDMGKAARQAEQAMTQMQGRISGALSGLSAKFAAFSGVISAGAITTAFIRNTIDAQNELAQLNAVLRSTGEAAGFNSMQLMKMADTMAQATTHSAGEIVKAQTRLLSYSSIVGEQFPRALQMAIDQSARLGEGIEQSAETIGKALEKPSQGVTALTKQGFRFEESQKQVMKALEDTGRLAEAQAMVLDVMGESYAGAAEAARDTFGGAVIGLKNTLNDLLTGDTGGEGLKGVTGAINDLTGTLNDPSVRDGFASAAEGMILLAAKAAEAMAMVGGLYEILNQAPKALSEKNDSGLIQERLRVQERVGAAQDLVERARKGQAKWYEGPVFGASNGASNVASWEAYAKEQQQQLDKIDATIAHRRLLDQAAGVRIIDDGQALPESVFKNHPVPKPADDGKKKAKPGGSTQTRQVSDLERFAQQAARAAAAMRGPLDEAMTKHLQNMAQYNSLVAKGNIAQGDANVLMAQSATEYAKVAAQVEQALGGPEALIAAMNGELAELGKVGRARELYRRQLMNERDMRQELQKAVEAAGSKEALALAKGAGSYEQYERSMLDAADAAAALSLQVEEGAANVEAWANVVLHGVDGAADAMADFVASGLRDFNGLWDDLKDTAKQGLRDLARELLQQKLVIPIQTRIMDGISNWGSQGGGFSMDSLMGLFGGNGSAGGGQNVGNLAGILSKGQGLFSGGTAAAGATNAYFGIGSSAGSMAGFGSNVAGFAGGGASAGAGAGAAGSTAAAAVPIIGWIVAGMMKNAELFDQGWDIANGESWAGKIATAGAVGLADKGFRGLGFNDKTASILSGSSIHAKLFGRSAPKVTGQGLTGSYGFGGFDGQSYADIKAKGGMFRSDKKWTQYGSLDPGIDRTFDMAARQVRGATTDLAKQLGVDLSGQLAGVKVSLGKLQLSADSAEAKSQLEAYLGDMTDRLFTEAVKAAGFGGQLDGYFEASDVFSALSASIALAVGNADQLGRALNSMEIEKVNKAVDYFQDLASVAGTDLATQIEKVSGLLGNYASLMADISTQLLTGDLTQYQSQALTIERTYRQQVKAANDYAKALGLSGARAEDLAKIEALRATNMGKLQAQIDADKKAMRYGLDTSDLSRLTDQEKLQKTMQELERAVAGGDTSAAQAAAQAALGFGRNLYASGQDYNGLYGQVTGLIDSMKVGNLDTEDGTSMGQLADAIEALPDNFSRAVFDLVVEGKGQAETNAALQQSNALLAEQNQLIRDLLSVTTTGVRTSSSSAMREALNAR